MAATLTLLALAANAGLSPSQRGAVEAMLVTDEFTPMLPVRTIAGTTAFAYDRQLSDVTASWIAADTAFSTAAGLKRGRVLGETRKVYAQPDVTPEAAARLGGAANVHADLAVSAFTSMSRSIANKAINGSSAPTAVIDASSPIVASGCVSSCTTGGQHDLSQGNRGELKYTVTGTLFRYRAPGDVDFGDPVAIAGGATGTVYSKNGENYVTLTRGATAISASTTAVVTVSNGANEPDGVLALMNGATRQWIYAGDNGGAVTFRLLDQLVDTCKGASDRVIVTNKAVKREIRALLRDKAGGETFADVGAKKVLAYDGIPIIASDYMLATRTRGTASGVCSAAICMSLGEKQGLYGIASTGIVDDAMTGARLIAAGPFGINCYALPVSQTTDSIVDRAVGYMAFANELIEGVAILDGITVTP